MTEELTLPPIVKYSDEISLFIEGTYSCMDGIWYNNPLLFQKMGEGLWREWLFEKIPEGVQKDLMELMPNKNKTHNDAIDKTIETINEFSQSFSLNNDPFKLWHNLISKLQELKK